MKNQPGEQYISATRWMGLSVVIGLVSGLAALLFSQGLHWGTHLLLEYCFKASTDVGGGELELAAPLFELTYAQRWPILFLPALGGLLAGWLVHRWAPNAGGDGVDSMIRAFHKEQGRIPLSVPLVKMLASIVTIVSGGSAGREGPIALIGAGFASWVSQRLGLNARRTRLLIICGVAAGIGAIFKSPLGGAIFAVSVLYADGEFEYEALMPAFLSAIVAYSFYCSIPLPHWGSIFNISEQLKFQQPVELVFFVITALTLAALGPLYTKFFFGLSGMLKRLPVHPIILPALGGLGVGVISFCWPVALGGGYYWVQATIDHCSRVAEAIPLSAEAMPLSVGFLIALVAVKILATTLTVGSGGSGGLFAPSLVIGGCLGGALGLLGNQLFPGIVTHPEVYVLVGMAGFFGGVANTPIAALIMVLEMTVGYGLLVPLMTVCAITYFVMSPRFTIYQEQVPRRFDSPAHLGEFVVDVLERMTVGEVVKDGGDFDTIAETASFQKILDITTDSQHTTFPVCTKDKMMSGIISYAVIRPHLYNTDLSQLLIARDIMIQPKPLTPRDTLDAALRLHLEEDMEELPVVAEKQASGDDTESGDEPSGGQRVIGLISRRDIIAAYHRQMRLRR